jgi:hypothetical protein
MAVLLVDALGWELAASTSGFAAGLPHRRRLETILGFSSGALPTLFTGRLPSEHGRWLMYRRAAGHRTPFGGFRWLGLLPPRLRRSWKLTVLLTRLVARRGVRGYFSLYQVPRELLEEFDLAERDDIFTPGGLPGDSLWDTAERSGVRWRGWNWRTPEPEALSAVEQALRRLARAAHPRGPASRRGSAARAALRSRHAGRARDRGRDGCARAALLPLAAGLCAVLRLDLRAVLVAFGCGAPGGACRAEGRARRPVARG